MSHRSSALTWLGAKLPELTGFVGGFAENKHAFRRIFPSPEGVACLLRSMPVPDLIVGKLRCAQLPAELAPLLADLARPPTRATGSRPGIDPFVAVALQETTARVAGDDDPAGLAPDHLIFHQKPVEASAISAPIGRPRLVLSITGPPAILSHRT